MAKASLRSLRTQLAEQTRTAREEIDALMDDRTAMQEEMDKLRKRHEDRTRQSAEQWVFLSDRPSFPGSWISLRNQGEDVY